MTDVSCSVHCSVHSTRAAVATFAGFDRFADLRPSLYQQLHTSLQRNTSIYSPLGEKWGAAAKLSVHDRHSSGNTALLSAAADFFRPYNGAHVDELFATGALPPWTAPWTLAEPSVAPHPGPTRADVGFASAAVISHVCSYLPKGW